MVTLTSMKVFTAVVEAEEGAVNLNASPRGTLRLTMPVSFGILHMGPTISAYLKQYPEVKIDIQLTDRRVDPIEEDLDLAVCIGAPGRIRASRQETCLRLAGGVWLARLFRAPWRAPACSRIGGVRADTEFFGRAYGLIARPSEGTHRPPCAAVD